MIRIWRFFLVLFVGVVWALVGCERTILLPTQEVEKTKIGIVTQVNESRKPAAGQTRILGTGWYANVEVDSKNRLHFAWVDADLGDVYYAVTDPDGTEPGPPQPVEVRGAVGSYLQLALGRGDTPIMTYYHQDAQVLRMAHREADLAVMKKNGADVALASSEKPVQSKKEIRSKSRIGKKKKNSVEKNSVSGTTTAVAPEKEPARMGEGWFGETVVAGDNVGMASKLRTDAAGRPHLVYRTKGEKLHYARRPPVLPAFGEGTMGKFEISVVDPVAGASYTMSSDLLFLPDQTMVISYCHWNFVDASLKLAILPAKEDIFTVLTLPLQKQVDGWHSSLLLNRDGTVAVYSVASGDRKMFHFNLNPSDLRVPATRQAIMERPGPSVVKHGADGTIWILTRGLGIESLGEKSGVWLVEIPQGNQALARRWMLEFGAATEPWIDLALRTDGRPVAVWTAADQKSMRIYAP